MPALHESIIDASQDAARCVVIQSANPIHDTGGGQRSAQLALEFLERDACVVFVSHGKVTETVDLGLEYGQPRLVCCEMADFNGAAARAVCGGAGGLPSPLVITQVPVRGWARVVRRLARAGAKTVYDCVDRWDSELGAGWYDVREERALAREAALRVASAPELVRHVEELSGAPASLLPNAFNHRMFQKKATFPRPADLPEGRRVALYVGALWGRWFDWDLVERSARRLPDTAFVFVGDHRAEGEGLPGNCHFLGLKAQAELPAYLAHADVAFLPWRVNDITRATSPLKVYEFVAMGLPVVAPGLEPLEEIPGVLSVETADGFVDLLARVGRAGLPEDTADAMDAFGTENSWAARVDALTALADVADAQPNPRRQAHSGGALARLMAWLRGRS
jgi:glycosyltransferase involved in cell wall biosynthesis